MGLERAYELVNGKPADARDITTVEEARQEISQLRILVQDTLDSRTGAAAPSSALARGRAAFCSNVQKVKDYEHVIIEKPEETRDLILNAIEQSILFKNCGQGDLAQLVEAFRPVNFLKGTQVITQDEAGEDFYVVEEGSLRCFVVLPGDPDEVEVRKPYKRGESFGELALMYNNPRAATLRAWEDCKLWAIKRNAVRAIITSRREKVMEKRIELLGNVVIGEVNLKKMLSTNDIKQLANVLEEEEFPQGGCIVREGEVGHAFYIVQSGKISVHQKATVSGATLNGGGDAPSEKGKAETINEGIGPTVAVLRTGAYFGERALLSEETRKATCVATAEGGTVCLSLGREDFSRTLGSLEDAMAKAAGMERKTSKAPVGGGNHHISLKPEDLAPVRSIGQGAFGNVKLVMHKPSKRAFVLKCQGKKAIVANDLQSHILEERRLLMELDHPFILKLHDSFQDDRYVYFVLEALMGGEIFMHLRRSGSFEESAVKFYAATVLCALEYMHERFIAYRDLKPENLVLDDQGYVKLVDLGLAKIIPCGYTWTICGTPDYLAPEIILNEGHDQAVDFWALGVLIYEMLAGVAPFAAADPMSTYENILARKVQPPTFFSKSSRDIVRKLLKMNKSKRLGKTAGGSGAVMKHKWFSGFDWAGLLKRKLKVPIEPKLDGPFDTSHFTMLTTTKGESEPCPEWTPDF